LNHVAKTDPSLVTGKADTQIVKKETGILKNGELRHDDVEKSESVYPK
jgi:hypothetical protein